MDNNSFDQTKLNQALAMLEEQLELMDSPAYELVVCGGSALIAMSLVARTTCDVDVLALMSNNQLISSEPLPKNLMDAAEKVGRNLNLSTGWLNSGPTSQLQLGLPEGFQQRLTICPIGGKLTVYYISRIDQIFFKTFAAADRGGYHVADLRALNPTEDELVAAALWCMTQDVSPEFRGILRDMFQQLGWPNVRSRI